MRTALARALAEPAAAGATRLFAECTRDGRLPAVVVYGRGLGIWDGRRQFQLAPATIAELLGALRDGGFAELAPSYGGRARPGDGPAPAADDAALKVTCRVRLELGPLVKEVVQLEEGEQSSALRGVADAIYRICEPPARAGIEATSLEDGLEKVARGELAAETLSLVLHRKPELHQAPPGGTGFLLRLAGRELRRQPYTAGSGYGAESRIELDDAELAALAGALARHRPGRLPPNLWAREYTDFELAVLGHRVALQARRFTGMTAATHGEAQRDFEAVVALLAELEARAARDGLPVPDG